MGHNPLKVRSCRDSLSLALFSGCTMVNLEKSLVKFLKELKNRLSVPDLGSKNGQQIRNPHRKSCLQKKNFFDLEKFGGRFFFFLCDFSLKLCHHRFQNGLKTLIFYENRFFLAHFKAKTVFFNVVQFSSILRFYRKHNFL